MSRSHSLAALAWALCLSSCGEPFVKAETGATSSSGSGGSGGSGGSAIASATSASSTGSGPACESANACGDCMVPICDDLYCACLPGTPCAGLAQCIAAFGAGPSPAQIQICLGQNPAGISDFVLFGDCAVESCPASALCGVGFRDLPPCEECAFSKCESEMNTCYAQKPCADLVACYATCSVGDAPCADVCIASVTDGIRAAADAVAFCAVGLCAEACKES